MKRLRVAVGLLTLLATSPIAARADTVLDWNALAVATMSNQGQNPFAQARFLAITQLAVFEAVNATTGEYRPYLGTVVASAGSRPDAAAATAAYRVLKTYFPAAPNIDAAYAAAMAAIPNGSGKSGGIAAGELAAAHMIASRVNDGSAPPQFALPASADPGVWQLTPSCAPNGGVFVHWQYVRPFGIASELHGQAWIEQFRPGPPPSLSSPQYARDYNEVRQVGSLTSDASERPADRALVAQFFAVTSPAAVFNLTARQLAVEQEQSITANARALALVNMALNDSQVAAFATKYFYNFWRPETAIRAGDADGNKRTTPDEQFAPFIATPCFPSYPSNHGSASGGAAEMLKRLYGARHHQIVLASVNMPGIMPEYSSLDAITDDIDDARVYGGIHFRFDQDTGERLGRRIADHVYQHNLRRSDDASPDQDDEP